MKKSSHRLVGWWVKVKVELWEAEVVSECIGGAIVLCPNNYPKLYIRECCITIYVLTSCISIFVFL